MIVECYGIPPKLFEMFKGMYGNNQCSISDDTCLAGWFYLKPGVKQGRNMPGSFFLFLIEWISKSILEGANSGD